MKVLIVSDDFPLSKEKATSNFVLGEASELSKRGIETYVVRGTKSFFDEKRNAIVEGVFVHNFSRKIDSFFVPVVLKSFGELAASRLLDPKAFLATLPYTWFITKIAKESKIDLIHAHFAYPEGFSALLARGFARKPLIVTLHGYDIITAPSINYGIRLKRRYDSVVKKVQEDHRQMLGI